METVYLRLDDEENKLQNNTSYRQAVGALLYIATITRSDVLGVVNILSLKNNNPLERD